VSGRLYAPTASDEIVLSEDAAAATRLRVGDVVRIASWHQADLDAAIDGSVPPQTPVFTSRVVGIARGLDDVQASRTGDLSESIPGDVNALAGPGWMAAHGGDLAGYGAGVAVRVRGGLPALTAFEKDMRQAPEGWLNTVEPVTDVRPASVLRVIDLERRALLVFAFIAIVAGTVFVGLTAARQLRLESVGSGSLTALGMRRRDLRVVNVARALSIAVPGCVVALATVVGLSPLGPLGLARRLEFDLSVRLDAVVLASTVAALLVLFSVTGIVTPVRAQAVRPVKVRASRWDPALCAIGPVAVVGATAARGRSSRAAVAVTAVAIAAGLAAGSVVASYDRLVGEPERYGASWDVVVGQYSQPGTLADGVAKLRANGAVIGAAGYYEDNLVAKVEGQPALFLALSDFVGHVSPVMARGRAPRADNEAALGRDTARKIHRTTGDEITVVSNNDTELRLTVVGITVVNDPVANQASAGDGVLVRPNVFTQIAGPNSVAQSIVIKLDPHRDRAEAIESVRRDFSGSIREAVPQVDVLNLGRLRSVPWLIATLVAILALATLVHALITMLARNRTTLSVLAALGFTRGQRRGVGIFASLALVFVGVAIGIPIGLVISQRLWSAVTAGIDLPSRSVVAWMTLAVASMGAFGVAALAALVASGGSMRMTLSERLRVE
jgi:putative ABC transport system permease protein